MKTPPARLPGLAILATAVFCTSCISLKSDRKLFVFSEPSGASVYVDGVDTGFTTPAVLEPGSAKVSVQKEGYKTATRAVTRRTHFRYPRWNDGGTTDFTVAMCFFRTADDFFFPLQFETRAESRRIFVKLEPESPVSSRP
jgi:hypothetical protein